MDENNANMKKNKKKGLIIGGIVVILLLLAGTLTYFLMPVKPKKVFTTAIQEVYEASKSNFNGIFGGKYTISTDIHSDNKEIEKILEIVNKLNISMDMGVDTKSKKMHINLDSNYNNKELLKASIDVLNNNAYVFLNDIYNKNLLVPMEGMDEMFSLMENVKDYEIILKYFKDAFNKSLKDEYFTKENKNITLNGKSVKVTENKLILDEKNQKELAYALSDELNNEEFIESFSHISDMDKEEVKEMLKEMKENVELEDGTLYVSIYTKGINNEFVGIEFKDNKDTISILKNTKTNYSYEIKVEDKDYKGDIEAIIKDNDVNLKMSFDIEGISGSITMDFVENKKVSLPEIDTTNVIPVENLSESEAMEILNNLQNKESIVELMQTISSLSSIGFNF